jgi:hypothetical protein
MKTIPFRISGRVFRVVPGIALVSGIEEELGGLAALAARFRDGAWRAGELVTLTHIILDAAGAAGDWRALGDTMVAGGLSAHAESALDFLCKILDGDKA